MGIDKLPHELTLVRGAQWLLGQRHVCVRSLLTTRCQESRAAATGSNNLPSIISFLSCASRIMLERPATRACRKPRSNTLRSPRCRMKFSCSPCPTLTARHWRAYLDLRRHSTACAWMLPRGGDIPRTGLEVHLIVRFPSWNTQP